MIVRQLFLVFALVALAWSGLHAGPAEAHESDPAHAAHGTVFAHSDDGDDGTPDDVGQHGCHHHCPAAPAPQAAQAAQDWFYGKQLVYAPLTSALSSTSRAPLLDPPKA